ncbi:MAG TPA: peptidoglycan editing factor PgeF [Burkholderiaceae bacterium]|nr:peptidoglycan editing factor PgeF [Burkholderiaceae bacterium]
MRIKQVDGLKVITGPDWPGVSYFCTTRVGGVSEAPWRSLNVGLHTGDNRQHVLENRQRVAPPSGTVVWLEQVHGTDVLDADTDAALAGTPVRADAAVTTRPDRVLAIMVADCLPVVLGSADGRIIGAAHAGWRGLAAGVLENTLQALQSRFIQRNAPSWRAWIGPGISQPNFEVGDDVYKRFVQNDAAMGRFFLPGKPGKWLADLAGVARYRLMQAGVQRVDVSPLCTFERSDLLYSYRRDGVTGRQVVLVQRKM